jgi:hypothetical protein
MCWHKWELYGQGEAEVGHQSVLLNRSWTETALIKIYKCKKCDKFKGYIIDYRDIKKPLSELHLRRILSNVKEV